jgi:hypothetical protein
MVVMPLADFIADFVRDVVRDGLTDGLKRAFGKRKAKAPGSERQKILAKRRLDRRNRRKK